MRLSVFILLGLTACARPKYVSPNSPGAGAYALDVCAARFSDACFNVRWPRAIKYGGRNYNEFLLKIGRPNLADGSLIVGDTADAIEVDLWMPEMGHGTGPVEIERVDVGTYRVSRVYIPHGGLWEIRVRRVKEGRVRDEAALRTTL